MTDWTNEKCLAFLSTWLCAASVLVVPAVAGAQSVNPTAVSETGDDEGEAIVVVGSALAQRQDLVESAALPVTLFGAQQLEQSGARSVGTFLKSEPAFSGRTRSLATVSDTGGFDNGRETINLRGIGERYTLTLLGGRRFGADGPANVGIVPFEAIERIEVLKSGASAIYGSDAVAGAVNVVLKRDGDGFRVAARQGFAAGGYSETEATASYGVKSDAGKLRVLLNYNRSSALDSSARRVTASNDQRALGGIDGRSSRDLPAIVDLPDGTTVALNRALVPVGATPTSPADYRPFDFERDAHDRIPFGGNSLAEIQRYSLVVTGAVDITDRTELVTDIVASRIASSMRYPAAITYIGQVPATNPYNPFGTAVGIRFRGLDRGIVRGLDKANDNISSQTDVLFVGTTLKHALNSRLTVEASLAYAREEAELSIESYRRSSLEAALNRTDATAFNPFGNFANGPAQLAGILVTPRGTEVADTGSLDVRIGGDLFDNWAGPVRFNLGGALRRERRRQTPDSLALANDLIDYFAVTIPLKVSRDSTAAFAEVRVPLIAGDSPDEPKWELGAAARYEHFDDFGSTFNPLISTRFDAGNGLSLRASFNTSFRTPYLQELNGNNSNNDFSSFDPVLGQLVEVFAVTGPNADLNPEKAKSFTAGLVFQPDFLPKAYFSLDYFVIDQSNLIVAPDPIGILNGSIGGTVLRRALGDDLSAYPGEDVVVDGRLINIAKRKYSGIDGTFRYTWGSLPGGRVTTDLSASYVLSIDTQQSPDTPRSDIAGTYSFLFAGLPKFRTTGGVEWTSDIGEVSSTISARGNYVGSYEDPAVPGQFDTARKIPGVFTLDLFVNGDFEIGANRFNVTLGVDNAFNRLPPFVRASNSYDDSQHRLVGRFGYLQLSTNF